MKTKNYTMISLRIPRKTEEALQELARREERDRSKQVRHIIEKELAAVGLLPAEEEPLQQAA